MPQMSPANAQDAEEKLDAKMREIKIKQKEQETEALSLTLNLPYLNLKGFPINQDAFALVPKEQSRKLQTICFLYTGSEFRLAAVQPDSQEIKELVFQIAERTHAAGSVYLISEESFRLAFAYYEHLPIPRVMPKGVAVTEEELNKFGAEWHSFEELQAKLKGASTTDLVAMLVAAGLQANASDVHIEAEDKTTSVRLRIDGILHLVATLTKEEWPKIVSRVKLLSGLKINIADQPQDGRFNINLKAEKIDVRVSTIPTAFGESIVLRLLRAPSSGLNFESLGLIGRAAEQLNKEITHPNGMIISTGPTSSGKTTSLYAILNKLNDPETKIITLEDPIEYQLKGISQSQIDYAKDYTFAKGLRSILRQDPDIIMVGEIRDLETAEIAIQAALTGHQVISTIHTNSAAGAIPRFMAMGAKPFLLAPALNAIIGQRLVRRVCPFCKEEIKIEGEVLEKVKTILKNTPADKLHFYHGQGCEKCYGLGFKGRLGIYEIMTMNKEVEKAILAGEVSEYTLREIAVRNGMVPMVEDGLLKALEGLTTVEEIFKVAE